MKTLYITDSGTVMLDEDKLNVSPCRTEREAIQRIYKIEEDTHIVVNYMDPKKDKIELDAKADDIIIMFYENSYPNKVIIVNSPEWSENLTAYNDKMAEIESKKLSRCDKCDGDCDCVGCSNMQSC